METPPGQAAGRIGPRPPAVAARIVAALDEWLLRTPDLEEAHWLREVAAAADPDPWRGEVRTAWVRKDHDALRRLAAGGAAGNQ